ncbi:DUF333 domain-containing protein [Vibrio mediterranei]|uniref:DUF333 domain-containing protein n=1 Tax=Vibrio mediterranei TaxID=689 RepID=UPI001EFE5776|nr:DUF333 domain-containing protein [Vibrio mediterranei]MCG9625136.1 DUF333 domain-containing protein [Vibrio mediterranei]
MKKNSLKYLAGLIAVSTLALAGCSSSDQVNKEQPIGMANPAAVYCEEHGTFDLQTGQCTLKSGEAVDAWDYYRENHKEMPNEAARYCESTGGVYMQDSSKCALPDGKVMDAESYFRDHQSTSS